MNVHTKFVVSTTLVFELEGTDKTRNAAKIVSKMVAGDTLEFHHVAKKFCARNKIVRKVNDTFTRFDIWRHQCGRLGMEMSDRSSRSQQRAVKYALRRRLSRDA